MLATALCFASVVVVYVARIRELGTRATRSPA